MKLFILTFAAFLYATSAQAAQLIGIYTNLKPSTQYKVTIEGDPKEQKIDGQPYQANLQLPVRVKVNYTQGGKTLTKTISIRENPEETVCAGTEIIAEVEGYPTLTKTICLSDALNRSIRSIPTKVFQNVLLAISNVPQTAPDGSGATTSDLPFTFGISAWSSTKAPWNAKTIAFPLSDPSSRFSKPLTILQGYNAWGGGTQPPLDYANIMNLYNNTPFSLIIKRTASSAEKNQPWKYFNKVVPPYTAIPWASIWIPKAEGTLIAQPTADVPEISIFVLSPPIEEPLPPSFDSQTYALGESIPQEVSSYNDILKEMEENVPTFVEETTGQPSLSKYMIDRTFVIGKFLYKLITDQNENKIKIIKCSVVNLPQQSGLEIDNCAVMWKSEIPATEGRYPNFFELIINPAGMKDEIDSLKFELKPLPEEKL